MPLSSSTPRSVPLATSVGILPILLATVLGAQAPAPAAGIRHVASRDFTLWTWGNRFFEGVPGQIDNAEPGRPDRLQIIKGLSDTPLAGQMLRLEVLRVTLR